MSHAPRLLLRFVGGAVKIVNLTLRNISIFGPDVRSQWHKKHSRADTMPGRSAPNTNAGAGSGAGAGSQPAQTGSRKRARPEGAGGDDLVTEDDWVAGDGSDSDAGAGFRVDHDSDADSDAEVCLDDKWVGR